MKSNLGCEKYGTAVMNQEDCLLFAQSSMGLGADVPTTLADMKMIDTMLYAVRQHKIMSKTVNYTKDGGMRKNAGLQGTLMKMVEGNANGDFNY
jgi:hypothetical protein